MNSAPEQKARCGHVPLQVGLCSSGNKWTSSRAEPGRRIPVGLRRTELELENSECPGQSDLLLLYCNWKRREGDMQRRDREGGGD